jgi:hypothetical protein
MNHFGVWKGLQTIFSFTDWLYQKTADWMMQWLNWYIVIFLFVAVTHAVYSWLKKYEALERLKQSHIVSEVKRMKDHYKEDKEKIKQDGLEIVKGNTAKPHRLFVGVVIKMFVFLSMLHFFRGVHELTFYIVMPITSIIITFLFQRSRKVIIIQACFAPVIFFAFSHLSGAANVFYLLYSVISTIKVAIGFFKKKPVEQEPVV